MKRYRKQHVILIDQLKEKSKKMKKQKIVKFTYLKSSSEIRMAFGTTNPDFIKDKVCCWGESLENYVTTAYFSLEKCGWHLFRWENLIAVF